MLIMLTEIDGKRILVNTDNIVVAENTGEKTNFDDPIISIFVVENSEYNYLQVKETLEEIQQIETERHYELNNNVIIDSSKINNIESDFFKTEFKENSERLLKMIINAGDRGMTESEIRRKTGYLKGQDRIDMLKSLTKQKRIALKNMSSSRGRHRWAYIATEVQL